MGKMVIRHGAFETNSSSQHSICFMKNVPSINEDKYWDDIYIRDGVWDLSDKWGEALCFGRSPFRILTTPGKKARYAIANLVGDKNSDEFKQIFNTVKKLHPELKEIKFDFHTHELENDAQGLEYVKKCHNGRYIEHENHIVYWTYDFGYVDDYLLRPFLKKYNISIEQFIVERNIIVVCDGDEYCEFLNAKEAGLIDVANILVEYDTAEYWEDEHGSTD